MINLVKLKKIYKWKKARLVLGFLVLYLLFTGCETSSRSVEFSGFTMGTTYSVKTIIESDSRWPGNETVKIEIDSMLNSVNQQMSTYINDSEISIFNKKDPNIDFNVSENFIEVIRKSMEISLLTKGAFDITIKPLV